MALFHDEAEAITPAVFLGTIKHTLKLISMDRGLADAETNKRIMEIIDGVDLAEIGLKGNNVLS